MEKKTNEYKLNSKKMGCISSAFNSIEQSHDAEFIRIREEINKQKVDWLKTQMQLLQEEYNFLWDIFRETYTTERIFDTEELFLKHFDEALQKTSDFINRFSKSDEFEYQDRPKLAKGIWKKFS